MIKRSYCIPIILFFFLLQMHVNSGNVLCASTWVSIGPEGGSIRKILQDPSNPNTVYLISSNYPSRLFKSTDKGDHWSEIELDFQTTIFALESNVKNPSEMFMCGIEGFSRSTDSGATWSSLILNGFSFLGLASDSVDQNILHGCGYVWNSETSTTSMAYFKSTNKGTDWSKTTISPSYDGYLYAVAADPKNSKKVWVGGLITVDGVQSGSLYCTTDGGTSWTNKTGRITGTVQDIFIDSTATKQVLVVTSANTYRSTDNGASWQPCPGFPSGNRISRDPKNRNTFYIAGNSAAYRSTDGGLNWDKYSSGLTGGTGNDIAVDRSASNNAFGAYSLGFFKSTDGGTTWKPSNNGLSLSNITALRFAPGPSPALYAAFYGDGLYKTTDPLGNADGTPVPIWTRLPTFYDCTNLTDVQVAPNDPEILYAFEGGG